MITVHTMWRSAAKGSTVVLHMPPTLIAPTLIVCVDVVACTQNNCVSGRVLPTCTHTVLCVHTHCVFVRPSHGPVPVRSRSLALDIAHRIWDNFLLVGPTFLFRTALGLVKYLGPRLMASEFEQAVALLNHPPKDIEVQ